MWRHPKHVWAFVNAIDWFWKRHIPSWKCWSNIRPNSKILNRLNGDLEETAPFQPRPKNNCLRSAHPFSIKDKSLKQHSVQVAESSHNPGFGTPSQKQPLPSMHFPLWKHNQYTSIVAIWLLPWFGNLVVNHENAGTPLVKLRPHPVPSVHGVHSDSYPSFWFLLKLSSIATHLVTCWLICYPKSAQMVFQYRIHEILWLLRVSKLRAKKSSIHSNSPHLKVEPSPTKSSVKCKYFASCYVCCAMQNTDSTAKYTLTGLPPEDPCMS